MFAELKVKLSVILTDPLSLEILLALEINGPTSRAQRARLIIDFRVD